MIMAMQVTKEPLVSQIMGSPMAKSEVRDLLRSRVIPPGGPSWTFRESVFPFARSTFFSSPKELIAGTPSF